MSGLPGCVHEMIHRHPTKSVEQIAEECGVSASCAYKWALPTDGDDAQGRQIPAIKLALATRATGNFLGLDYLEQMVGRAAHVLPVLPSLPGDLTAALLSSVREAGDVAREGAVALASGIPSKRASEALGKEIAEAIRALVALDAARKAVGK